MTRSGRRSSPGPRRRPRPGARAGRPRRRRTARRHRRARRRGEEAHGRVPQRPPTRCTPTTSRESSKPNRYFSPTARAQTTPARTPMAIAPSGVTEEQDGVMATRPATTPDAAPSEVAWPSRIFSTNSQPRAAAPVATMVLTQVTAAGRWRQGRAGVEAEPAEPQQAGAEHHERQVVRTHRVALAADPLAQHEREGEAGGTGVDVHRGTTGEVDRLQLLAIQPPKAAGRCRRRRRPSGRPGSRRPWPRRRRRPSRDRTWPGRRSRRRSARR